MTEGGEHLIGEGDLHGACVCVCVRARARARVWRCIFGRFPASSRYTRTQNRTTSTLTPAHPRARAATHAHAHMHTVPRRKRSARAIRCEIALHPPAHPSTRTHTHTGNLAAAQGLSEGEGRWAGPHAPRLPGRLPRRPRSGGQAVPGMSCELTSPGAGEGDRWTRHRPRPWLR